MDSIFAAIDIGSNSTNLLITDSSGKTLERIVRSTRLGAGLTQTGSLSADELLTHTEPLAYGASNADVAFIHAVATNTPAYPDVNVALQAHRTVDAMYRSAAQNGSNVSINE